MFDSTEQAQLLEVLASRSWGGYNPRVQEFERTYGAYVEAPECIAVANGTVSLEIALKCDGIATGDEVIVPPYTFMATASSVLQCGAVPVFADIEAGTLTLDPQKFESAITARTRAVIPVHFAGHPADMDRILAVAERHDLVVIEDAAHAHGSEYNGRRLGSLGDWGSFSFQASKIMTSGEGGCLVTPDPKRAANARAYCNQGRTAGGAWYDHETLGSNLRLTGFQAAVLLAQLARLDGQIALRSENAASLRKALNGLPTVHRCFRRHTAAATRRHSF
jgi:dTDP-4-amino-4,6-dideoxygalactose transaminase